MLLLLLLACDADADGVSGADDCDPASGLVFPGAREACNGKDDDCDGQVDETFDLDGDGVLADEADCRALGEPTDCDDTDPTVFPGAEETCDGRDEDCSGVVDDAGDADGDGVTACDDCDDDDPFVNPAAPEACNGVDDDCSGAADEPWDADGDGTSACQDDCDDDDPDRSPDLPEVCDGVDNDCDDEVDEGFDEDGDGWATCRGDCDDRHAEVNPDQEEACGGVDSDCDETTLEDADVDGDGVSLCDGDCDDGDAAALPGGTETCDGADNDCNGATDELPECWSCTTVDTRLVCLGYATWDEAEEACDAYGLHLPIAATAETNAALGALSYAYTTSSTWLGLTDAETEDAWLWADGTALDYSSWYAGEPNNSGNEDCASTNYGSVGAWNDYPCSSTLPFICEP